MKNTDVLIILGSGNAAKKVASVARVRGLDVVQIARGNKIDWLEEKNYLNIGNWKIKEIGSAVDRVVGDRKVLGAVNRMDDLIYVAAWIVDRYKLSGVGLEQARRCKNKALMHGKMEEYGLEQFRPKTTIVSRDSINELRERYPYILKPCIGSKSRGVRVVKNKEDQDKANIYYQSYFSRLAKYEKINEDELVVLQEEYLEEGKQLTLTCYVDRNGELEVLHAVDVYTGKDLDQKHQQLVFRVAPSTMDSEIIMKAEEVLRGFVGGLGLKNAMIHPEFLILAGKAYLIEVNLRIGGFRSELTSYVQGISLEEIAVNLALDEAVSKYAGGLKSVTAVEVWSEEEGKITSISVPHSKDIKGLKIQKKAGDKYIAPPEGSEPLARFFVTDSKNSLAKAREIYERIEIEFE